MLITKERLLVGVWACFDEQLNLGELYFIAVRDVCI